MQLPEHSPDLRALGSSAATLTHLILWVLALAPATDISQAILTMAILHSPLPMPTLVLGPFGLQRSALLDCLVSDHPKGPILATSCFSIQLLGP